MQEKNVILFGGGFLSHNIAKYFKTFEEYKVHLLCRRFVNRGISYNTVCSGLDLEKEFVYFKTTQNNPLILVNCAVSYTGGEYDFINNLRLYTNFHSMCDSLSDLDPTIINFGSGAEYIESKYDDYGKAKRVIREICTDRSNWLRIWGCFGEYESSGRFIRNCFERAKRGDTILIRNKVMDFVSAKVVAEKIKQLADDKIKTEEVDCAYDKGYSLLEIAEMIIRLYPESRSNMAIWDDYQNNYHRKTSRCTKEEKFVKNLGPLPDFSDFEALKLFYDGNPHGVAQ